MNLKATQACFVEEFLVDLDQAPSAVAAFSEHRQA